MKNSCTLLFLLFTLTTFAQPGTLDSTFGNGGIVLSQMGNTFSSIHEMAIQDDGKIVAIGYALDDFAVARYNIDGSIDSSFGVNGSVTTSIGVQTSYANDVAIQNDGKIVVAGYCFNNDNTDFAVVRYNTDGSLDNTFDYDGIIITPIGSSNDQCYSVAIQGDGKIVVAGLILSGDTDLAIIRYNSNGSLDNTFGSMGIVWSDLGGNEAAKSIAIQSDGKILIGGSFGWYSDFLLARYDTNGTLEFSLTTSLTQYDDVANSIAIQPDGKIILAGYSNDVVNNNFALVRYNNNGSLDNSFGTNGKVITPIGNPESMGYSVCLQADGKIIVAGGSFNNYVANNFVLARYNIDGGLDNTFDTDGKLTLSIGNNDDYCDAMIIQTNGDILLGGSSSVGSNSYFTLARLKGGEVEYNHYGKGYLFNDVSGDCSKQIIEKGLKFPIQCNPGNYYAFSNDTGYYSIGLNDFINYTIQPIIPERFTSWLKNPCPSSYNVYLDANDPLEKNGLNFGFDYTPCYQLRTDVSSNRKRRCFRNSTNLSYTNEGLIDVNGVEVRVKFDAYDIPLSANIAYTVDASDSSLVFNIGTLNAGQSGYITIVDSVACVNGITGLTQCTKSWILPPNTCLIDSTTGAGWDHSSIVVSGECADDTVRFVILNHGSGDMLIASEYRIYVDNLLSQTETFQLISGDSLVIKIASGGATIRLEADQHPDHPGRSHPRETIEACGTSGTGTFSIGQVNQAPMDDDNVDIEIDCLEIIDSYDPNEKIVSPKGIGLGHIVLPETALDFIIHFQNTGTDTAYTVVVVDTLNQYLDLATLELGVSSHIYKTSISGEGVPILKFTFDNINLVDSTTNEFLSHGYIKFKITPKSSTPLGTRIENFANIYFDYNLPIKTNTTLVRIDNYSLPTSSTTTQTACDTYTAPDGVIYTSSGIKTAIIENVAGYDSTITINLIVKNRTYELITKTACTSYTAHDGIVYTTSGTKTAVIPNTVGCDSIITINLTINEIPSAATSLSGTTITATTTGATYQWFGPCAVSSDIVGATNQTYTATANGNYMVAVTKDGCSAFSPCVAITTVGTSQISNLNTQISIFPNPSNSLVTISNDNSFLNASIKLTTIEGALVYEKQNVNVSSLSIDLNSVATGIYFIQIIEQNAISNFKLIKN
ncbi:MAG: T9SS type A sorting domain-containing protein [Bacteroidota bacterium]